jgi:tetratricopeptide (TPR) repeat protein
MEKDLAAERTASARTPAKTGASERARLQAEAFDEARALDDASNSVLDLVHAGKLDEAEQAARELLERYPQVPDGHERLGMIYEARGDHRRAAECYRSCLQFIRAHPGGFDPEYEQFLLSKLDPPSPS